MGCSTSMKYIAAIALAILTFAAQAQTQPLKTVDKVELDRYVGKWYEIASFPNRFQRNCTCTTAEYSQTTEGYVKVVNKCNKKKPEGRQAVANGKAYVVDKNTNAKLSVTFFKPFYGDYNIIELAPDYSYAVIGTEDRKYLWILSRAPVMDANMYAELLQRAQAQGFDTSKLKKTLQKDNCDKPIVTE